MLKYNESFFILFDSLLSWLIFDFSLNLRFLNILKIGPYQSLTEPTRLYKPPGFSILIWIFVKAQARLIFNFFLSKAQGAFVYKETIIYLGFQKIGIKFRIIGIKIILNHENFRYNTNLGIINFLLNYLSKYMRSAFLFVWTKKA